MSNEYEALARALMGSDKGRNAAGSLNKLRSLMNSEEGQRLAASLSGNSAEMAKAAAQAALKGDEAAARSALAGFLSTPDGAALFRKIMQLNGKMQMDELNRVIADIMANNGSGDTEQTQNPPVQSEQEGENIIPSGLMGLIGGLSQHQDGKMGLLEALRPHMNPERQDKVDRICGLVRTAYMIRGVLSSLGGLMNV